MPAKKSKVSRKKSIHKKHSSRKEKIEKTPELMVQIGDPKILRKDILESLREIILFMQSYEKFRAIQEEKVQLFTTLKSQVKEISSLIQNKLPIYLPKGKLKAAKIPEYKEEEEEPEVKSRAPVSPKVEVVSVKPKTENPKSDIDDLEMQLKDIENQLQDIQ